MSQSGGSTNNGKDDSKEQGQTKKREELTGYAYAGFIASTTPTSKDYFVNSVGQEPKQTPTVEKERQPGTMIHPVAGLARTPRSP